MIIVDCRGFPDPHRDRRRGPNHIGTDEGIIRRLVEHPDFPEFWRVLWERMNRRLAQVFVQPAAGGSAPRTDAAGGSAPRTDAPGLTIVFYCKKGRHRSVAAAWLATQLLGKRGYNVQQFHAMRDFWQLGTCNECAACAACTEAKLKLARRAAGYLRELPPAVAS